MNSPLFKRRLDILLAVLFAIIISVPTFYTLCGFHRSQAIDEYRTFEEFPGFTSDMDTLRMFGRDLEKYYDDHFGGRELLIACHLRITHFLFPKTAGGIIVGSEGWLYSLDLNMLDNFMGDSKLTLRQLRARQQELEQRRDLLAARGIKYLFVITPNKESVYPQYLPEWLQSNARPTLTDQFVEYMRLHSTVEILDLRPILKKASEEAPVFYKTDTHWNLMGAFTGCEAIIQKLSHQYAGMVPLSVSQFTVQRTNELGGDTARYAGMLNLRDDTAYKMVPMPPLHLPECMCGGDRLDMDQFSALPVRECPTIVTTNSACPGGAVVFGDSYTYALAPFMGLHFGKVTVLRERFEPADVDQLKPAVVIDEKVERWLHASFQHG